MQERFSDAVRISDIGFELDKPDTRLGGRQLVEGEYSGVVGEQPLDDCRRLSARGAGDDGEAANKGIGHWRPPFGSASA